MQFVAGRTGQTYILRKRRRGAFSYFAIMGYMELGDAFSDYGFSYEDLLANGTGVLLGYVLHKDTELVDKIDHLKTHI